MTKFAIGTTLDTVLQPTTNGRECRVCADQERFLIQPSLRADYACGDELMIDITFLGDVGKMFSDIVPVGVAHDNVAAIERSVTGS